MSADENLQRMKTLDDAWNAQNREVFRKRHSTDTKVYWPGQPNPTMHPLCHRQTPFPAVGRVTNVMVVGASVTVPAVVAAPSNAGIASAAPSASSFPFSCTRVPSRRSDDKV